MSSFKKIFVKLLLTTLIVLFSNNIYADTHDKDKSSSQNKEEPLPLNDRFVGDSSFSGGVKVITEDGNSLAEKKRIDLYTYKLVGIINQIQIVLFLL